MTVDVATFRGNFPEFADTSVYPDAMVQFWLNLALTLLAPRECRWAGLLDHGVQLITAHQLVLASRSQAAPGVITAPQTSKSVDKVAVSYDVSAVKIENAGHWNGTSYGIQFFQLVRMVGAGGMQL